MKLVISIILAWFVCQTIKFVISFNNYHRLNIWIYLEDGGMPSSPSTMLSALTTGLFYETGASTVSVASLFITLIFISHLMKSKPKPGIKSELMARFIDIREILRRKLTESLGHTPEQVFFGTILGFVIVSIIYMF